MKIFLWIVVVILLLCLGGVGTYWFMQNSTKNTVGSMIKDKNLQTCAPVDKDALALKIEASIQALQSGVLNSAMSEGEVGSMEEMEQMIREELQKTYDSSTPVCTTELDIVLAAYEPLIVIIMESLESARSKAKEASAKASIASTVPAVIICIDDQGFVTEPAVGTDVCEGQSGQTWPDLSHTDAMWGGCEMQVDREAATFEYCATLPKGLVTCSNTGCTYP